MGYPHFSGDCCDYHDVVRDWTREPQAQLDCPKAPGQHHSYKRLDNLADGVERWQCEWVGDASHACGEVFTREPDKSVTPKGIVTLCGSTRFFDAFQQANYELTMGGYIVLSVGFYPHASELHGHGEGVGHDSIEKAALDELHKRKIDLSSRVHVLNVGGYVGDSTRSEIEYAKRHGRQITYLEPIEA